MVTLYAHLSQALAHTSDEIILIFVKIMLDKKTMIRHSKQIKDKTEQHMNNKQIKNLIEEGFGNLYQLTYTTYTDYRAEMLDYEMKAEKDHRSITPWDLPKPKFSATVTAKYFVLKAVRSAMLSNDFRPRDILHCKHSYILAHAIKDDDRFDLDAMFDGFDWQAFESIDYSQGDLVFKPMMEVAA